MDLFFRLKFDFSFQSLVDSSMTRSTSDLNAITVEIDSVNSSPGTVRVSFPYHFYRLLFILGVILKF